MSDTGSSGLPPAANSDFIQNALLVGGALALLALAAFFTVDLCIFCGPPKTEVIDVSIDKSCASRIEARVTANQSDRDVLVWRVESECPTAQNVLICVTSDTGAPLPLRCHGDPGKAVLDKPFLIDAAQSDKARSYVICALEWPTAAGKDKYEYGVEFLTGDANTTLICPTNKDYELALEVLP